MAISYANAATTVSLNTVEVTGGGANSVNDVKITTRNAGLIKDVMRDIIGVYVRGTNSMNQKIFIRGISDRGLNITVDGAKQMGNTFHHNADLLIDPELLKSVEVAVGAKSAISGGIGGSVAFRTVDAKDLLENGEIIGAKIKSGYASNNDEFSQGLLIYSAPIDGLDILAAINRKRYDWGKSGNDMKMGGDGSDLNYLFKVGYNFFDAHKIAVSHEKNTYKGIFPMRAEFSSWLSYKNSVAWRKYERVTSTLKYEYNPSDLLNLQAVAYNTDHKRVEKSKWGIKTNGLNLNATTKFQTADLTHTLRYGTEFYTSENYNKPGNLRPEKAQDYAFYVQNSINFNNLTLTPGLRYEKYKLKTYKGSGTNISKHSYEFDKFTPSFSFDYEIGAGFGVFTSYAKVFSGPEMMEAMAVNRAKDYPVNKNLKATTGDNYEFGTRYKTDINKDINLNFTAKYFKSKYKNLISLHKNNASRINVGGADIDGFEIFAMTNLYDASFAFGYTKQDIKYKDRVLQPSKKEYYRSDLLGHRDSGDKYTFNVEYALSSLDLLFGYNLLYFASQSVDEAQGFEKVDLPSYCVSDFYVTYAPLSGKFKGLEINAGIYNAFNKAYSAHSQRNKDFYDKSNQFAEWEAGRNFKINLSYKF